MNALARASALPAPGGPLPARGVVAGAWRGLRSLFAPSPAPRVLTTAQLINQQEALQASLVAAMNEAGEQVAPQWRQAFAARAAAMVSDVVADSMYPVHSAMIRSRAHTVDWALFQAAAQRAGQWVQRHRKVALSMQPMWDPAPHLQRLASGRILVLRAAPAIESLVLAGGGVRGVANAPALRALDNLGLLPALKQVVGSSAGAMTAVLLAAGVSPKEFQQLLNGTDVISLLTTPADFARNYPGVRFASLGFDAGAVVQTLDRMVALSAARYLDGHWAQITRQPQWARFTAAQQQRLDLLRRPDFSAPRTGLMLTFGDLQLLHQLDPARFKALVVTGWNQSDKRLAYFCEQTRPDMPLALAGRISMGIPGLFADVKIAQQGQVKRWSDGGVGSNLPSEVVFRGLGGQALQEAHARTLVMAFVDEGRTHAAMHGPPGPYLPAVNPVVTLLSGNPQFPQAVHADQRKLHAAGLHVMPVAHGDLGVASFLAGADRVARAKTEALDQALVFIAQNRHNFRHDLVDDVQAAAQLLSPAEQDAFLARPQGSVTLLDTDLRAAILAQRTAPGADAAQRAAALDWARRDAMRAAT
ncbi:patatin-like phospholipase family protein [Pantoea sp. 18069]|uniref:patatin-like phospholipase family protein n=1 Tax=Pantoea sp. 18069 TaxID=2681415 RepID=UPI0013585008|nr:patatin-like phospholipase family protein [Pantoea sp. 18069]